MARYEVNINTNRYVHMKCSKKNWEHGTINDFMVAINGWKTIEKSLQNVMWRLLMFSGDIFPLREWDEEKKTLSAKYLNWKAKKCNLIKYTDRLCGLQRWQEVAPYGFKQGYLNTDEYIKKLATESYIKIPFSEVYDIRQYYKGMDGCYMEIKKVV